MASNDEDIINQIQETYSEYDYLLDPHTATGIRATRILSHDDEAVVTMATAHPAKFVDAIKKAIPSYVIDPPKQLEDSQKREEVFTVLPDNLESVKNHILKNIQ